MNTLYSQFSKTKLTLSALCFVVYLWIIVLSGGSIIEYCGFFLCTLGYVLLPGYLLYRAFRLEKSIPQFAYPLIFTLGCGFLTASYAVVIRLHLTWFYVTLLPILLMGAFFYARKENFSQKIKSFNRPQVFFLLLVICSLLFVYAFTGVAKFAHPATVGELVPSQDFLWNVGNAESFKLGFPPIDLRFDGVRLQYHYFTELFVSALSYISGISSYNILGFYAQSFFLGSLIICLYQFGVFLYQNTFKANLFTVSFFCLSCLSLWKILPNGKSVFNNSFIVATITNINSMANALCFLIVFCALMIRMQSLKYRVSLFYFGTLFGSFLLLTFTKSPIAALVAIALVCTTVARILQKAICWKELAFGTLLPVVFYLIYIQNFSSGANVSTGFSISKTLELGYFSNLLNLIETNAPSLFFIACLFFMLLQAIGSAPFIFPVFLLSAFKGIFRFKSLSFWELLCYASGAGGFLAYFLSYHEAYSQVYFLYVALFFCTCVAIQTFDFKKPNWKNIFQYTMLTLSVCTSIFLYVNLLGSGLRQMLFNYDILPKYDYTVVANRDDENAGNYLRSVATPDDVFVTNRIHTGAGEGLSNIYSGFSGMQAYMEGFKYSVSNMGVSIDVVLERLDVVSGIFNGNASPRRIKTLCAENGITYIVHSNQLEGSETQLSDFEIVFESDTVTIYKLP